MRRRHRFLRISVLALALASMTTANSTSPAPRYGQSTVYTTNTAYFLGGILSDTSLSTDFFSLDLSQEFNSSFPPWQSLAVLPAATGNAAAAMGVDGRIYLFGGQTWACSANFLDVYDPATSSWGTPQFFGTPPVRRQYARTFISNDNEVVFYFGGSSTSCSTGSSTMYNTLNALSLQNSSWFNPGNSNPPVAESDFAITKVKTGGGSSDQILIIGGQTSAQNALVQMTQLGLYDIDSQSWTSITASTVSGQDPPESRIGHTAVTTSDGKVIVYGGIVGPNSRAAMPQLTVLDTTSTPFQWSNPTPGNESLSPSSGLIGHSAILNGDTMILAFGQDSGGNFNQQTYFLDTQKMEWQDTYIPTTSTPPSSSPDSPPTTSPKINPSTHTTNPVASSPALPTSNSSNKSNSILISTSVPLAILALAAVALIIYFRRRSSNRSRDAQRNSKQRLLSDPFEMKYIYSSSPTNTPPPRTPLRSHRSTRVFKRIFSRGKAHASPPPNPHAYAPLGVYLPAWAHEHAREGGSNKSSSGIGDDEDDGVQDRMVQVASMSFMAPKMQLRVVNPDQESMRSNGNKSSIYRRVSAGRQV